MSRAVVTSLYAPGACWFGELESITRETEEAFGVEHTDIIALSGPSRRLYFPLISVSVEVTDTCPLNAIRLVPADEQSQA